MAADRMMSADGGDRMVGQRFASLSNDEKEQICENIDSSNKKKSTATAVKVFREYLTSKNLSADFESFTSDVLDKCLSDFYMEMRDKNGNAYKKSTFIAYRHGIQRYLGNMKPDEKTDIIKGDDFKKSIKSFKSMTKELKRQGKAAVESHPPISDEDLEKAYSYLCNRNFDDVQRFQYRVFLDIMLHLGRRGRENLASLTRSDFAVKQDGSGVLFVYQTRDEQTKNHQDDSVRSSNGRMYEIKDNIRCPVRSFVKYVRMLNPQCPKLFQQIKKTPVDGLHFNNVALSHNRIGTFMTEISKAAKLSVVYTNHSCRSTTVHVLDAAHVPSRHIMTVTGHKSESSLRTYSGQTDDTTKKYMSSIISEKIRDKSCTISSSTMSSTTNSVSSIEEPLADIDVENIVPLTDSQNMSLMEDLDMNDDSFNNILRNIGQSTSVSKTLQVSNHQQSFPFPVCYNCQNVTINYNVLPK